MLLCVLVLLIPRGPARAERLSDLADVLGARENQLVGYGVVTGLDGTGDDIRSEVAEQTMRSLLRRLNVQVTDQRLRLRNVAAVLVTATLPPFSRNGQKVDVTVSSIGNARSLSGGVLVQTPLRGADRKTYAVAQGALLVGGFAASGRTGTRIQVNSTSTGRIPEGAIVEREVITSLFDPPSPEPAKDGKKPADASKPKPDDKTQGKKHLTYALRTPDFVTAQRAAKAINDAMGAQVAEALDGASIRISVPDEFKENPVPLLARLGEVEIEPHQAARVIVNERTGTVVLGGDVRLSPVVVAQGGISISISESYNASQPNPLTFRSGQTVVTPATELNRDEKQPTLRFVAAQATLSDVATALSALGVTPRELSSLLQALRAAGALRAELIVQ